MQRLREPSTILPCIHPKDRSPRNRLKDSPSINRFAVDILAPVGMLGPGNPGKVCATTSTIALEEDIESGQKEYIMAKKIEHGLRRVLCKLGYFHLSSDTQPVLTLGLGTEDSRYMGEMAIYTSK